MIVVYFLLFEFFFLSVLISGHTYFFYIIFVSVCVLWTYGCLSFDTCASLYAFSTLSVLSDFSIGVQVILFLCMKFVLDLIFFPAVLQWGQRKKKGFFGLKFNLQHEYFFFSKLLMFYLHASCKI